MANNDGGFEYHLNKITSSFNINNEAENTVPSDKQRQMDALQEIQKLEMGQLQGGVSAKDLLNAFTKMNQNFPDYKGRILSMILNLNNSVLDAVANELLFILEGELQQDIQGLDLNILLSLVGKLEEVVKQTSSPDKLQVFHKILLKGKSYPDEVIQSKIQDILRGLNLKTTIETEGGSKIESLNKDLAKPLSKPSAQTEVIGASNKILLAGLDDDFKAPTVKDNQLTVKSKDEQITVKVNPPSINADIITKDGFMHAMGTLGNADILDINPFIAAIIQITNIQPVFVISQIATQFLVEMTKLDDEQNQFKIAIVTDNVGALADIDPVDYIRKVNIKGDINFHPFYSEYKLLYEEGYRYIISLHINKNLKNSFDHAEIAKDHLLKQVSDMEIKVHNTNANGVGLSLMMYEINQAIRNKFSPMEVNQLIQQLIKNYKHWVTPFEFDFFKNHQWVSKLVDNQKKVKMRLFHFVPVVELDQELSVSGVYYTKETAMLGIVKTLDEEIKKSNRKITRICIEYNTVYREAINIRNKIKVRYPTTKVSLHSVGTFTTNFFGPELIGVCVL